jgi:hypothetical protein
MRKLSKEKRNNLIMVVLLTVLLLAGLGFGLIRFLYDELQQISNQTEEANKTLVKMKLAIQQGDDTENKVAEVSKNLNAMEADMASGDLYSWGLDLLRRFRADYKVEVPAVNQPTVGDTTLLPKFPYKQATFPVAGSAYYHDFGRFIADFENQFPHLRIVNLALDPAPGLASSDKEKLEFKMDVVALVKPNPN